MDIGIVNDLTICIESLQKVLATTPEHRVVWVARNGQEAVEECESNLGINLVLMDIKMPVMNGKDAMNEIKKLRPDLPIIALSAFAMESDKETALANGFDSYLSKPIDKKLLFELINKFSK